MSAHRKATAVLEASGAFIHDPQRRRDRDNEPTADPVIGNAPEHLTEAQQGIWQEIMSEIPPLVATKADRQVIEIVVRMVEKMRHNHKSDCESGCPGQITSGDYGTLSRCLSQLGMTPADRSKIRVEKPAKTDEWEEDFGRIQAVS
jgi:phage terminase small subunit